MTLDQRDKHHLHAVLTWLIDGAGRQRCPDDVYVSARVLADRLTDAPRDGIKATCQPKEAGQTPDPTQDTPDVGNGIVGPLEAIGESKRSCQE
jgi:hypothetical protein